MKRPLLLALLFIAVGANASSEIVVKLGRDTKNYNANLLKLKKDLRVINLKLTNLDRTLAIASNAAGEANSLERSLKRVKELAKVTELVPSMKDQGESFMKSIDDFSPEVSKAREVSEAVSEKIVQYHKEVIATNTKVVNVYRKVHALIKKDIPKFHSNMTETQDCVYKSDQTKRECMQNEFNEAAEDIEPMIEESNNKVLSFMKTLDKLGQKVSHLQKVLKDIHTLIDPIRKLEYQVHRLIVPFLNLHTLMQKDYEVRYLIPKPYEPKKKKWFYIKVSGKDIIIGTLHTMDEIEKRLKGQLLKEANKASVKKLAQSLNKKLAVDLKKVVKKLNLNFKLEVPGLSRLHTIDSTLVDPLEEHNDIMKEVALDIPVPQAVMCEKLAKECR